MNTDIAIIGMSGLFPGAKDLPTYWSNILNKVDNVHEAPDEWASPYFDPEQSQTRLDSARIYTRKVGLIGELAEFNPLEFGIPPKAIEGDPAHFLALKLAGDALKDANYQERPFNRQKTGIILGRGSNPNRGDALGMQYGLVVDQTLNLIRQLLPSIDPTTLAEIREELRSTLPPIEIEQAPSLVSNVASGRIANRLDLMGPNYIIDAACSSSLIAVQLAIQELVNGRCDMMLAGGIQGSMPPQIYMLFCQLNALSRSQIRPFDQAANGTLLSEGVGFIVLKRLADAQRDADRIYAVIKGIGIASDGKGVGLFAPRLEGEILALKNAYAQTGIEPTTLGLIEAHGTGIPLGDETEIKALSHIFGKRQGQMPQYALGSIKSMIGHCIPAAGIASLIKTSLSLYYKILPPTLCDQINPKLDLENTPFYINTEARPWIHDSQLPRRAGVNAFGFGGINAHAILEEYREPLDAKGAVYQKNNPQAMGWQQLPTELLTFAQESRQELINLIHQVQQFLTINGDCSLANLAYTLSLHQGSHRLAILAKDVPSLQRKLNLALDKLTQSESTQWTARGGIYYAQNQVYTDKTAFLFPTEGSQYVNMLADLCMYFPQARAWFDFLDETFPRQPRPSQFIFPPPTSLTSQHHQWVTSQLFSADLATETVSTASLAIYEILRDFGIPCDVMVGHSAGEHVALRASGIAHFPSRSHLKDQLQRLNQFYQDLEANNAIPKGVLLSVGAVDSTVVQQLIQKFPGSVYIVADNCPSEVLLFISERESETVITQIQQAGGIYRRLPFDRAYHTPLFTQGVESLRTYYQGVDIRSGDIPVYSCATTLPYPTEPDAIRDLCAEQWSQPVRFRETIERLYQDGVRTFIEVGTSNSLTAFVDNSLKGRDYTALPTNTQRQSGLAQIQALLGRLFVKGVTIDFTPLYEYRTVIPVELETLQPPPPKPSLTLNLLLPRMSLRPEFVQKIQDKLAPQPELAATIPEPNGTPILNSDHSFTTPKPDVEQSPISQPSSITTQKSQPHDLNIIEPEPPSTNTSINSDARLSILQGHFELMQEFLANQSQVTELFCSSQKADESKSD